MVKSFPGVFWLNATAYATRNVEKLSGPHPRIYGGTVCLRCLVLGSSEKTCLAFQCYGAACQRCFCLSYKERIPSRGNCYNVCIRDPLKALRCHVWFCHGEKRYIQNSWKAYNFCETIGLVFGARGFGPYVKHLGSLLKVVLHKARTCLV